MSGPKRQPPQPHTRPTDGYAGTQTPAFLRRRISGSSQVPEAETLPQSLFPQRSEGPSKAARMSVRMSRLTTSQQQDSQEEVLQNLQIRLDKILSESRGDPSASFTSSHRRKTSLTASTHSTVPVRSSRRTHGVFLSSLRSIFNFLRWLIDTWTRVAVSLTTVLYQPLDLFSLLFWATAASAILGAILVFELVAQIPVISGALDDLTDYLVAGPKSETSGTCFPPDVIAQ